MKAPKCWNICLPSQREEQQKEKYQILKERGSLRLKKRVAFASKTGTKINTAYEQCLELPRAIATTEGHPVKDTKSTTTKVYEKQYEHTTPTIITTALPQGWLPDSDTVVIEGMFLINLTPWSTHKNIGDCECQIQSPKFFLTMPPRPHKSNLS